MKFDFSGAETFLAYLDHQADLQAVFEHPAYRLVRLHRELYFSPLTLQDIEDDLAGRPSNFYGLGELSSRLASVLALMETLRSRETEWMELAEETFRQLLPGESTEITVYPIIGYDMGIGLRGAVSMNLNVSSYLSDPLEFFYYMVHECTHVIYERSHAIAPLREVTTPSQWRSYFNLWLQNEGFAVYAPLRLRQRFGGMEERDYRVLSDLAQLEENRQLLVKTLEQLGSDSPRTPDENLELCYGPDRLTYRMGCEIIRRIEAQSGPDAVREAFYLDADTFFRRYSPLLGKPF